MVEKKKRDGHEEDENEDQNTENAAVVGVQEYLDGCDVHAFDETTSASSRIMRAV